MCQRALWRMLHAMYVQVPVSSMDSLQVYVGLTAALRWTSCCHLRWMADQYRHPKWSPGKQLVSTWNRHCLQLTPFPEIFPQLVWRDPSQSRTVVPASPGVMSHMRTRASGQCAGDIFLLFAYIEQDWGLSSEERNPLVPKNVREPRMSESELVITSPEGKGGSKGASRGRKAKAWRGGSEGLAAAEGEGPPILKDEAILPRSLALGNFKATLVWTQS